MTFIGEHRTAVHVRGAAHLGGPEGTPPMPSAHPGTMQIVSPSHCAKRLHRDARGKTQKSPSRSIQVTLSGFIGVVTAERPAAKTAGPRLHPSHRRVPPCSTRVRTSIGLTRLCGHIASRYLVLVSGEGGEDFFFLARRDFDEVKGAP